jgi:hypothetical protein
MSMRFRIAFGIYLLVALLTISLGLVHLFSPKFMSYHQEAIGKGWAELEPRMQILFLALMKGFGGGALGTGLALGMLTLMPIRRGNLWVRWVIPIIGLVFYVPVLYAALIVRWGTQAPTPWRWVLLLIILLIVGFVMSRGLGDAVRLKTLGFH